MPTDHRIATGPSAELPDIAKITITDYATTLDWVGMGKIELPLQLTRPRPDSRSLSYLPSVQAHAEVFVNLNQPQVKGIHMSRLYLLLTEFVETHIVTPENFTQFLSELLQSHHDISDRVSVRFDFDYSLKQPALKSQYAGWKAYPSALIATYEHQQARYEMLTRVPYASTCPCSAALARQRVKEIFSEDFKHQQQINRSDVEAWLLSEKGSYATPHSQRSQASVLVKLPASTTEFDFAYLINRLEAILKTPVQTAVKREDEQAFAELNGQNLMFCEDAARRLKTGLNRETAYADFWLRVEHYESLHAHDAVSITTKGISGGYHYHPQGGML
jgi:GTP cyclohydrolase I